jgi:hypothetical protein
VIRQERWFDNSRRRRCGGSRYTEEGGGNVCALMLLAVFLRFLLKNGVMARFENRGKKNDQFKMRIWRCDRGLKVAYGLST